MCPSIGLLIITINFSARFFAIPLQGTKEGERSKVMMPIK
jgi:hypothetical protein